MGRSLRGRRLAWVALLVVSATLAGCTRFPSVLIDVRPAVLTVVAGDSGTVTLTTSEATCDPIIDDPTACVEPTGRVFDFVVQNLPPGIVYTIDNSLQSPSTPGLVRITFDVAADVVPGSDYAALVHAMVDDFVIGSEFLHIRVLPRGPTAPNPGAAAISAGSEYSLAALADGSVRGWGRNDDGQLGTGDRTNRRFPTAGQNLAGITAVAAGRQHSLALTSDGLVWAWGSSYYGQLGIGTSGVASAVSPPVQVPNLRDVQAIAVGEFHSVALKSDGTVWIWGSYMRRQDGYLGVGETVPVQVQNLPAVRAIAADGDYTIAVAADGTVWIWGRDALGVEPAQPTTLPTQVTGLSNIRAVATRDSGALALDASGRVFAWGRNGGRLGDGTMGDLVAPVQIQGLSNVASVALGNDHGAALTLDGSVWEWGTDNLTGGATRLLPTNVPGLSDVVAIAAGYSHTLALERCGQIWAWGANNNGQLGYGGFDDRLQPTVVASIGDGCNRVTLRVSVITDVGPVLGVLTSVPGGLVAGNGPDYLGVFDRGTGVSLIGLPSFMVTGERFSFEFESWAIDCAGNESQTAIVVDRNKHCAARYRNVSPAELLLSVSKGQGGHVTSTGGGVLGPAAIDCGVTCDAIFLQNTSVTLTAADGDGFDFAGWGLDCSGSANDTTIVMDGRKRCMANYRPFELSVSVNGGGRVASAPAGLDCPGICTFTPRADTATLFATPSAGWQFAGWGGGCFGLAQRITVSVNADKSCTATFTRIPGLFFLNVIVEGEGSVLGEPGGIACPGACVALLAAGTSVELTARETSTSRLLSWFEDCSAPGALTNTVVMDSDKRCRVRFSARPAFPVPQIAFADPVRVGSVVTFDGSASYMFDPITGAQDQAAITFFGWDFEDDGVFEVTGGRQSSAVVQYAFQASGDHRVRLQVAGGPFNAVNDRAESVRVGEAINPLFGLTVNFAGTGNGVVTTNPSGLLFCDSVCTNPGPLLLESGTTVTLIASAKVGSTFAGWSGAGCTATTASIQVTLDAARACTAAFNAVQFTLTVNNVGSGVVNAVPPGIVCGADCSERYDVGTAVILTATPSPGFQVAAWTGCDTVNGNECLIQMNANRAVGVTFSAGSGPFTLTVVVNKGPLSIGSVIGVLPPANAINCRDASGPVCTGTFPAGTVAVVRPSDTSIELGLFDSWSGCDSVGGLFACTVSMTSDRTVVATFSR